MENTKDTKESKMVKSPLKDYKFWFKIFGGVILVAFAIVMIFNQEIREKMCIGVFGGIILVYALYRIIPLIKTLKEKWSRILCIIEIIIDLIVGGMLIAGGFNFSDSASNYSDFINKYFRFFLGSVVYLRGLIYTITAILVGEKSNWKEYLVNIACLTFGVAIMCIEKFNATPLAWVMVLLAFASGGYIIGEGGYDYGKYRKNFKETRDGTTKEKENGAELGEKEEKADEKGDNKNPEVIIPEEKPEEVPTDPVN